MASLIFRSDIIRFLSVGICEGENYVWIANDEREYEVKDTRGLRFSPPEMLSNVNDGEDGDEIDTDSTLCLSIFLSKLHNAIQCMKINL